MPMCHGAGRLAGQYYFGARIGGTNEVEGLIEVGPWLFLALTVGVSLVTNMAIGFVAAMIVYHSLKKSKVMAKCVE